MSEQVQTNPWKGLQSYQETDVIFGRDDEIKELYTRVVYDIQTVVYGKSGIGKSSIINAGIIPRAKFDGMFPVNIRLAHTTKKGDAPTEPYVEQIKKRIEDELEKIGGELEDVTTPKAVETSKEEPRSLWELLHRYRMWAYDGDVRKRLIPLLLFDQFEEIFTLETDRKRVDGFFAELADLLNEVKPDYLSQTNVADKTPSVTDAQTNKAEMEHSGKPRNVFSEIASRKRVSTPEYLEKSEFHLVITLREDFLSDLERHTNYIPVMKTNRFAILPLNEEQAAKIIMEPVEGLVSKPVAKEIIERVTGRTDFQLDDIPEIEVNASLLSLYMEQLYKRKQVGDTTISSETLVQYGDDIIKNFYEESICGIPDEVIETLEDELITNSDKRDNVARIDLIAKGVDESYIDQLLEKKVLQQFYYNEELRVELIHDILCPVVNNRISNREQIKKDQAHREREALQMRKLKQSRRFTAYVAAIAIGASIAFVYAAYKYFTKPTTVFEDKYVDVMLVFNPDETLQDDPWEADVELDILKDSTTEASLLNNMNLVDGMVHIKGPGSDTIMVRMLMEKMEKPFEIKIKSRTEWLCANDITPVNLKRPNADSLKTSLRTVTWTMSLTRDPQAMYTLMGKITTQYGTPIYDAFVVLGEKLSRTNANGEFTFRMNDSTELMGSFLHVFKSEYVPMSIRGVEILRDLEEQQSKNPLADSYVIALQIRDEYKSLYNTELMIVDKIINGTETLTKNDSNYISMYFGDDYYVGHANVASPDTIFHYVFRKAKNRKDIKTGRVFGYYLSKSKKDPKPFNGYMEELEKTKSGTKRWKLTIAAHDSIFNKERITGILQNKEINLIDL